jgi:hypothetical protein
MSSADLVFWPVVAFLALYNFYSGPRIRSDQIAMQWGSDGKAIWHAPKAIALWGMFVFALVFRLLIWILSTYVPSKVHGVELAVLIFSITFACSQVWIVRKAIQAS